MGAIVEFNFNDFINAIKNRVGQEEAEKIDENTQRLKSIFDIAARTDYGEDDQLLETDSKGFNDLVNGTVVAFKNLFKRGKDALKQVEFIPGDAKTKKNGALIPDKMNEYENGELVRTVIGFDEDDNEVIDGKDEVWTELEAGDWRTKQNGALTPDKMKEYDVYGNLVRTVEGFDDDNNGWIEGNEIWK